MSEPAREAPPILFEFGPPPPRRVDCPLVDAHLHVSDPERTRPMVETARAYGVVRAVGVCRIDAVEPARRAFGPFFDFAVSLDYRHLDDPARFRGENLALLDRARELGVRMVKFWFKPQFTGETGLTLDDPRMEPILRAVSERGMACLVHVADPDSWFQTRYADARRFGTKAQAFVQLERVLERFPGLLVQGAHMAGHPEDLDHLGRLLDRYPNLCLDTSATKWVVRELGRQPAEARRFFIDHADRILFGTDLVPMEDSHPLHYASRYWTLGKLLESDYRGPSPIRDPDHPGPVRFAGLDLPADVLRKLYCTNAERLLGIRAAAEEGALPLQEPNHPGKERRGATESA